MDRLSKADLALMVVDFRARKNLTQQELADAIGITKMTISRVEQGVKNITWRTERKIINHIKEG